MILFALANVAQAGVAPDATWRVVSSQPAPWAAAGASPSPDLLGGEWRMHGDQSRGSVGPRCDALRHRFLLLPADGLFEGGLPAPANSAAAALGISRLPALTERIECDNASVDIHFIADDRALLGWDNRVLTLQRSPVDDSPLATAAALLRTHFRGDMGFAADTVAPKSAYLSDALQRAIAAWFARPRSPDEAPEINGDPFTDAQEYPTSFELSPAIVDGDHARLQVRFADEAAEWSLQLQLVRTAGGWRVDDVLLRDGSRLRELLRH